MAKKKKENFKEQEQNLENFQNALTSTESFFEKHSKLITTIFLIVLLGVAGWFVYQKYMGGKEEEAQEAFATALPDKDLNFQFTADSILAADIASVADEYSRTKTGNLAKIYAGMAYYQLGDYDSAIEYLESAESDDDLIHSAILGTIGDCYVQKGEVETAINYFNDAAAIGNDISKPIYMVKAGKAYESLGDYDQAIALYTEVKNNIKNIQGGLAEVIDIEKLIAFATAKNGK